MIDRRQLLGGAAALASLSVISPGFAEPMLAPAAPLPAIDLPGPVVDIHCHIFNSSDLPIYGFLRQSVFEIYDGQAQAGRGATKRCDNQGTTSWLGRSIREAAAEAMRDSMSNAVAAAREADDLRSRRAVAPPPPSSITEDLERYFGARPKLAPAGSPSNYLTEEQRREIKAMIDKDGREALARRILEETGDPNPSQGSGAFKLRAAAIGGGICNSTGFISRHLCWAKSMTASRMEHATEIARIYDSPSARVRLFTPALIDYSYWLNDEPVSNLKSQVDAMEQVALRTIRTNKAKFHGYIAFDPLRDVHEIGQALALAQHAVHERGFIGVKLYPPMGFKPLGNAGDGDLAYPQHALRGLSAGQLALRLDQRLVELYKWCAEKGVPILSHAANSNGSGPCYAERADTANWLAVVAHPVAKEIRLCLAHIGSFDAARDRNKKINVNALQQSWEWHFGKLIQLPNAKNVYADLSYFSELLKSPRDEDFNALKQAFATLIRKFPNVTDRLIYGSDWIMLDRELKKEEHLKAVYWFLHDVFRLAQVPDPRGALIKVFSTNALKFLGLGKNERGKNDQTRERLLAFYRKYNLRDADRLLDEFVI